MTEHHRKSVLDQPLGGFASEPMEAAADRAARWVGREAWAPVVVALIGFATLTTILIGLGAALVHLGLLDGVRDWDEHLNVVVAEHRSSGWDEVAEFFSRSAETVPILIGAVLVELVLVIRRRYRDLLLVALALALELTTFLTVNFAVRRPRPDVETIGTVPNTFSFPSGHTAATLVLYGSIVILASRSLRTPVLRAFAWIVVLVLTIAVGYARVYRGMHHPIDVVTGAAMGACCLVVAVVAVRASSIVHTADANERSDRKKAVSDPTVTPVETGVSA